MSIGTEILKRPSFCVLRQILKPTRKLVINRTAKGQSIGIYGGLISVHTHQHIKGKKLFNGVYEGEIIMRNNREGVI